MLDANLSERDARIIKGWLNRILVLGVLLGITATLCLCLLLRLDFT